MVMYTPQKIAFLERIRTGEAKGDYSIIECYAQNYQLNIAMAFDNGVIADDLVDEAVKMIIVGLIAGFIWSYGKFRYRFLYEIKQLAVSGRPELTTNAEADEYEIIRAALKQSFEELKSKDEDFQKIWMGSRK